MADHSDHSREFRRRRFWRSFLLRMPQAFQPGTCT